MNFLLVSAAELSMMGSLLRSARDDWSKYTSKVLRSVDSFEKMREPKKNGWHFWWLPIYSLWENWMAAAVEKNAFFTQYRALVYCCEDIKAAIDML